MTTEKPGTGKKIALFVGVGCLAIVFTCCATGAGGYFYRQSSVGNRALEHARGFFGAVQARRWDDAYSRSRSIYDTFGGYGGATSFQACFEDTALGDITSFECDDYTLGPFDDDADVECTVTSASRGTVAVTLMVNSADRSPYNGFVWFASRDAFGERWMGDDCAIHSGREYFREPPAGRVRP